MAWFKRETDPIEERSRELQDELDRLQQQIKRLETRRAEPSPARPTKPENRPIGQPAPRRPELQAGDPIFEEVNVQPPPPPSDSAAASTPANLYSSTGLRKYDLPALIRRVRLAVFGGTEDNRKLINYLAAGSIHGLRPLRKERRVARNRALVAASFFALVIWGVVYLFLDSP